MPRLALTTSVKTTVLRRKQIVDAAMRLFSGTPYVSVQMDDVAHAAGVAKPTLYRYFATKEALFIEGMDVILGELADEAERLADAAEGATDALHKVVRIVLDNLGACAAAIRAIDGSDTGLGDRGRAVIRARVRRIREILSAVIGRGVASGEFRPVDTDLTAWAIMGSIRMVAANAASRNHALVARSLTELLLGGLAAGASAVKDGPGETTNIRDMQRARRVGTSS